MRKERVVVAGEAAQLEPVKAALERFQPKQGERLDHGAYERSKQEIAAALANEGFVRAQTVKHRVEVVRAANSAEIDLEWNPGPRHRFGPVRYTDAQFPDKFLQRYTPWREGEFYSTEKLLELQQTLVDADYFSAVAVTPDLEHAQDATVPVDVALVPAKRTVYTASVYVSTDTGPGTKLGVERRWLNKRGHKLSSDIAVLDAHGGLPRAVQDSETGAAESRPELRRRLSRRGDRQQHFAHGARSGHRSDRPLEGLHADARPAVSERRFRDRRAAAHDQPAVRRRVADAQEDERSVFSA